MFLKQISDVVEAVFEEYGLDRSLGRVKRSDRPELSDFQCSGAMQAARILKKNPQDIADHLKTELIKQDLFETVSVNGPGFLNFTISDDFIIRQLSKIQESLGKIPVKKILIDYGGPNVAKPLHVGHLRSAIIGESIKRTARALGHEVIADIHMGDWGTPMGMLIAHIENKNPEWPYFDDNFTGSQETAQPPFDGETLNSLYPVAAKRFKEDVDFAEAARRATGELQKGHKGYRALWKHFIKLSVASIKSDFKSLDVDFDLWLGESDADPYIENMVKDLLDRNIARESNGAIVIDVKKDGDKQDVPPLILKKRDGAVTYATTDLATIFQRVVDYKPDHILYVVDQRQALHFIQVFRAAVKAGFVDEGRLEHIGFGTMNGRDGRPFKTRDGGVMRLSDLIQLAKNTAISEAGFSNEDYQNDVKSMLDQIAIAAIKFGDLANARTADYIFDPAEFVRFEGKTGPYIQYTAVRALAILDKANVTDISIRIEPGQKFTNKYERSLVLALLSYNQEKQSAFESRMPSDLCDYIYGLARSFNSFYKSCPVTTEENLTVRNFRLFLTQSTLSTIKETLAMLAIPVPEKMVRAGQHIPSL